MKTIASFSFVPLAMLALGCAEPASEPDDGLESRMAPTTKAADGYYVVRPDVRRCAFPMCGGWFISSVNSSLTSCDDGTEAAECYVAELSLPSGIRVEEGDLVRGALDRVELAGGTWGSLEVDFAYASTLAQPWPEGNYSLFYDTGVRCAVGPCPSMGQALLGTDIDLVAPEIFFWGNDVKEDAALEQAFWAEYADEAAAAGAGALTFGEFWDLWGQTYYAIYNVYVPKAPQTPICVIEDADDRTTAWNFAHEADAKPLVDALEGQVSIVQGTCADQLAVISCSLEYAPVYGGIDARGDVCETHSNACQFRTEVLAAAGREGKARGQWSPGRC